VVPEEGTSATRRSHRLAVGRSRPTPFARNMIWRSESELVLALGVLVCIASPGYGQSDASTEIPLDRSTFMELARANDRQLENRLFTVERSGTDKVQHPPLWKYPDLAQYLGNGHEDLSQLPKSIEYRFREVFCVRDSTITFERSIQGDPKEQQTIVKLSPYEKWSNSGREIRRSVGPNSFYSIEQDRIQGTGAAGALRLAETELALGVGYAERLKQVNAFSYDARSGYQLRGILELIDGVNYTAELIADENLVVRSAMLSSPHGNAGARSIKFTSHGTVESNNGFKSAASGECKYVTGATEDQAGDENNKDEVAMQFKVSFVSLSELLSDSEYDRFAAVDLPDGVEVVDPDEILPEKPRLCPKSLKRACTVGIA
jgi:hypothetical protein